MYYVCLHAGLGLNGLLFSSTNSDEWSVLVRVPHAVTVEYRYLLVQCIAAEHNMALHITPLGDHRPPTPVLPAQALL